MRRRRHHDRVVITEPPIKKLSKERSCAKRACVGGCGCFVVAIAAGLVFLRMTVGPKTKELKELPLTFARTIPLYDPDSIRVITVTDGEQRARNLELAAYLPKLVVAPAALWLKREELAHPDSYWANFVRFMKEPVGDHRDLVELEWRGMAAEPSFIAEYYKTELRKRNFMLGLESRGPDTIQFVFTKDEIEGAVYLKRNWEHGDTEHIKLTIKMELTQ